MKSLMKKVFAAAAAIATVFGLAATTVATANAADGATLTVSTADAKFVGKTVNAYKMFSATVGGEGANKAVSYTLTDTWKPFFMDSTASGLNGATDANVNDKANEYVSELAGDNLVAFATKHRTGHRLRPKTSRLTRPLRYLPVPRTAITLRRSLVSTTATTWSLYRVRPWPTPASIRHASFR